MAAHLDKNWAENIPRHLVTVTVARKFPEALSQNFQGFPKVWGGDEAFQEGGVLLLTYFSSTQSHTKVLIEHSSGIVSVWQGHEKANKV